MELFSHTHVVPAVNDKADQAKFNQYNKF